MHHVSRHVGQRGFQMTNMICDLCSTTARYTTVSRPKNWEIFRMHAWIGKKVRYLAVHICPACQGKPIRDLALMFKKRIAKVRKETT